MSPIEIKPIGPGDSEWVKTTLIQNWESVKIASRGHLIDASALPGFIAWLDGERIGLVTYSIVGGECEIVSLNSFREKAGIGTGLISATRTAAESAGCHRLWLITTNDNADAVRFYITRGLRLMAIHRDAITESRRIKPSIPLTGYYGLPLQDELEFELRLK